jgi:hypothetical protein
MTDTALHVENLRGYPQGEIFSLNRAMDALTGNLAAEPRDLGG